MGKMFAIVRREVGAYWSTWTGYIIVAAALFIDGLLFNSFAMGSEPRYSADILAEFFYMASGIAMVSALLLSTRLIAEERQSGTLVLFHTSPVSERQLVYGKFFSAMAFFLFLNVLTLYIPALVMIRGKVSLGHLASGYAGLLLLGGACVAIGMFASSLASNQLVAAVLGALILVTLLVLWMAADIVSPPFKDVFSYVAIHNRHFGPFGRGVVHTEHLVYYASVMVFFLEASVRVLETRRWRG
jgi:ABC-2 type transport system permease protein